MRITFKLYATLADYLPAGAVRNSIVLEVGETESVAAILRKMAVPESLAHLVLVNGRFIAREHRESELLAANDELAVWPPIAGG